MEATTAVLARIESLDPVLGAYCHLDPEGVRAAARASEARWAAGAAGALDGVPVAVKDVFLTRGWPTLRGSWLVDAAGPWDDDAPAVAALRRAGAVLVGKTTTPELGWKGVTDSPRHGVTTNPWDTARTAGGSSGGSSAALVAGMATLALGTDGGGSIRIPAAFCGHPGLKPTAGRVPLWPPSPYGALAHAGPMARTVADLALLADVLGVPDPRDGTCLPASAAGLAPGSGAGVAGLRIAWVPGLARGALDAEVGALASGAAAVLAELGARVEEVEPPFADPVGDYETLWFAGAAAACRGATAEQRARMDPGLVRALATVEGLGALDYLAACQRRLGLAATMGRFHEAWDLLATPTVPVAAFAAGSDVPPGWPEDRWPTWSPCTYPFNLTGQPAVSVPCGLTTAGLPAGLQLVGPRFADALVLRAAAAYEATHPLDRQPPPLDAAVGGLASERS